jgi:hypothetical protein
MKWVPDTTGRFQWRPYYDQEELDHECQRLVSSFLMQKNREIRYPISTDDLSVLVERDTSDLDLYADLSVEGEDVEGITDFFLERRPAIRITRELSLDDAKYHRLRTTLAHEYGHVRFHSFLWNLDSDNQPQVKMTKTLMRRYHKHVQLVRGFSCFRCSRSRIFDAPAVDWMEWQASYASGAMLMPVSSLRDLAGRILAGHKHSWVSAGSDKAGELVSRAAEEFDVSGEAARVRLTKLGILQVG